MRRAARFPCRRRRAPVGGGATAFAIAPRKAPESVEQPQSETPKGWSARPRACLACLSAEVVLQGEPTASKPPHPMIWEGAAGSLCLQWPSPPPRHAGGPGCSSVSCFRPMLQAGEPTTTHNWHRVSEGSRPTSRRTRAVVNRPRPHARRGRFCLSEVGAEPSAQRVQPAVGARAHGSAGGVGHAGAHDRYLSIRGSVEAPAGVCAPAGAALPSTFRRRAATGAQGCRLDFRPSDEVGLTRARRATDDMEVT